MWRIRWAPNNARKWQMGFNSAFKRLRNTGIINSTTRSHLVGYFYTICRNWNLEALSDRKSHNAHAVLTLPELMILLAWILKKVLTSDKSSFITYTTLTLLVGSFMLMNHGSLSLWYYVSILEYGVNDNSGRVLLPSIYLEKTLLNIIYGLNTWSLTEFERSRFRNDVTVLVH
jgi:hypothetical protein